MIGPMGGTAAAEEAPGGSDLASSNTLEPACTAHLIGPKLTAPEAN